MLSFAVINGELKRLNRVEFWFVLTGATNPEVVSWATSGQKHHWLRAGNCSAGHLAIGSDSATIDFVSERDRDLLDAVQRLLQGPKGKPVLSRSAILSGDYTAPQIQRFGAARWAELELVVERCRGNPLLELVCWCAPAGQEPEKGSDMIDEVDRRAAELLYLLTESSEVRSSDGKMFWGGYLRHRVERFSRLPLAQFVSRMVDEIKVQPTYPAARQALAMLASLNEAETEAIEDSLQHRGGLIVALAYDLRKESVDSKKQKKEEQCASLFEL
jgi:hypothetical protein